MMEVSVDREYFIEMIEHRVYAYSYYHIKI